MNISSISLQYGSRYSNINKKTSIKFTGNTEYSSEENIKENKKRDVQFFLKYIAGVGIGSIIFAAPKIIPSRFADDGNKQRHNEIVNNKDIYAIPNEVDDKTIMYEDVVENADNDSCGNEIDSIE